MTAQGSPSWRDRLLALTLLAGGEKQAFVDELIQTDGEGSVALLDPPEVLRAAVVSDSRFWNFRRSLGELDMLSRRWRAMQNPDGRTLGLVLHMEAGSEAINVYFPIPEAGGLLREARARGLLAFTDGQGGDAFVMPLPLDERPLALALESEDA